MTLLITAVTPTGIVMCADSAMKWTESGESITLTSARKMIQVKHMHMAITIAGSGQIGTQPSNRRWISSMIEDLVDVTHSTNPSELGEELAGALDLERGPYDQYDIQLAGWTYGTGDQSELIIPHLSMIKSLNGQHVWGRVLDRDQAAIIANATGTPDDFPVIFATSGLPLNYGQWVRDEGMQIHSQLVNQQMPPRNISGVLRYVRFLVRSIAEFYQVGEEIPLVSEPIDTVILQPRDGPDNIVNYPN